MKLAIVAALSLCVATSYAAPVGYVGNDGIPVRRREIDVVLVNGREVISRRLGLRSR